MLGAVALLTVLATAAPAAAQTGPAARRVHEGGAVAVENAQPGSPGWKRPAPPAGVIAGYSLSSSVAPGDVLRLAVSTAPGTSYRVEVYRLGWYGGVGARLEACSPACDGSTPGLVQPHAVPDWSHGGVVQERWRVTDTLPVSADWTSGYYLAELVVAAGPYTGDAAVVPFVVRAPAGDRSQILVDAPVNTWQAYNDYGGTSFYTGPGHRKASEVSFDRPYAPNWPQSPLFYEYPLVRFLERSGYDVSYTTDVSIDGDPGQLLDHRLVIVAGHSEYWSGAMWHALVDARDAGVNLAFMGGNDGYREIAYQDGGRAMLKRYFFRVGLPECQLVGVEWQGGWAGDGVEPGSTRGGPWLAALPYAVAPTASGDPWFRGTGLTAASVIPGIVGYEWDGAEPGCVPDETVLFHYAGVPWAHPPASDPTGKSFISTDADAVRYTAPSGATVFAAGSIEFSWGLDDYARRFGGDQVPADPRLQQFMRNALAALTGESDTAALTPNRTHHAPQKAPSCPGAVHRARTCRPVAPRRRRTR